MSNKPLAQIWVGAWVVFIILLLSRFAHADTAGWYGTTGDNYDPFPHVWTANQERFNENSLTAASWKYPFNTRLKVTNLANGASVVVRVNDRGPARRLVAKGRILDLTRGAFKRIADLNDGVIKIKEQIL